MKHPHEENIARDIKNIKDTTHITYGISIIILAIVLVGLVFVVARLTVLVPSSDYIPQVMMQTHQGATMHATTTPMMATSTKATTTKKKY